MANWRQTGVDNYHAGIVLLDEGGSCYRSAVSRFYYAAFSLLTYELVQRRMQANFARNRATPSHSQLPNLVEEHLTHLGSERSQNLADCIRSLYQDRLVADYSLFKIDKRFVKSTLRITDNVFRYLGVSHE